jgi:hypothetical protein
MRWHARKTTGLTLVEMTLVVATIALLVGFAVPAVRSLVGSFHSEGGAKSMVEAALSSARAMATSHQRYVGVRFQPAYGRNVANPDDPLTAPQYMVFIIHDPALEPDGTEFANGFRAIEALKPVKLPDQFCLVDPTTVDRTRNSQNRITVHGEYEIDADDQVDSLTELTDVMTFSLIFSPSGKLVVLNDVRAWNRHGRRANSAVQSPDRVFNSQAQVRQKPVLAMFCQDDYPQLGLGPESSRKSFVVCERHRLRGAYEVKRAWTDYLQYRVAERTYVSPYTGKLILSE